MKQSHLVIAAVLMLIIIAALIWRCGAPSESTQNRQTVPSDNAARSKQPSSKDTSLQQDAALPSMPTRDRKKADAIRDELKDSVKSVDASASGLRFPEMPIGKIADGGDVLRQYIQTIIREDYKPIVTECYSDALKTDPKMSGNVTLRLVVIGNQATGGVIESAVFDEEKTTITDETFRKCLLDSVMSVSFDAPPGGEPLTIKYPIAFAPSDGPSDASQ